MQLNLITTGDKKLDRALATLPPKLQKKGIRKATRESAKLVLAHARRRAPRKSGALARSLTVRTAKRGNGKKFPRHIMGHAVVTRDGMFRGDQFYGGFLEFGTKPRTTRQGAFRGAVPDMRFMRPALYDNKRTVQWLFKRHLKKALDQIAREAR